MQNAIINITNLRLRTYIGFNPDEREKKQDVVINIEIHYPADYECVSADEVSHALNYKTVTKAVIAARRRRSLPTIGKVSCRYFGEVQCTPKCDLCASTCR